ncbi:MAG: hypothetical protein EXS36_09055 [Pedosphaera sp.]|nr:hypothetical protein [Pedosphaera sp.]
MIYPARPIVSHQTVVQHQVHSRAVVKIQRRIHPQTFVLQTFNLYQTVTPVVLLKVKAVPASRQGSSSAAVQ